MRDTRLQLVPVPAPFHQGETVSWVIISPKPPLPPVPLAARRSPKWLAGCANIEEAAKRLVMRQEKQKLARQLRERDTELKGSDDQVIEQYLNMVFVECSFAIAAVETAKAEAAEARMATNRAKYVAATLAGPSAFHLKRFLAGREATYQRVTAFFERSGLPDVAPPAAKAA